MKAQIGWFRWGKAKDDRKTDVDWRLQPCQLVFEDSSTGLVVTKTAQPERSY